MTVNPWTDEYTTALRLLWDGREHSARQCAIDINAKFGTTFSRNAVIGKVCRMGWEPHRRSVAVRKPKIPPQERRRRRRLALAMGFTPESVNHYEGAESTLAPAQTQRKQLLELKWGDCRWPFGDPGTADFYFCAAEKSHGSSYCPLHRRASSGGTTGLSVDEQQKRLAKYLGRAA